MNQKRLQRIYELIRLTELAAAGKEAEARREVTAARDALSHREAQREELEGRLNSARTLGHASEIAIGQLMLQRSSREVAAAQKELIDAGEELHNKIEARKEKSLKRIQLEKQRRRAGEKARYAQTRAELQNLQELALNRKMAEQLDQDAA